MSVDCYLPKGSVLRPPLFLIYINNLQNAIQYRKFYHFAEDSNLFRTSKFVKNINKLVNFVMKHLSNWLVANKISINVEKAKAVIFKFPKKVLPDEIKIKFSGKSLYPSNAIKKSWCKG